MLKKIFKFINGFWIKIMLKLSDQIDLTEMISEALSRYGDNYIHFKLRPKHANYFIPSKIKTTTTKGEFAIVLQGLIETRDNYTIETIKLYNMLFPNAIIIVSTWDYEDKELLNKIESLNCNVVLSKNIPICGMDNVNYQLCTSLAGVRKAKELGAVYVLKSRADLRFYKEFSLEYLKSILEQFPVEENAFNLKGRIITQAGNWGQMFLPLWLQDFWYFGYTDDLINLFDISYDEKNIHRNIDVYKKNGLHLDGEILTEWPAPEINITKRFIAKYRDPNMSLREWWNFMINYCFIVDQEDVNSYWMKYTNHNLSDFYVEYDGQHNFKDAYRHISAVDFLNILNGKIVFEDWMENEKKEYIIF